MSDQQTIEILRFDEVDFPDLCIGCMKHAPEDTLSFGTAVVGWWSIVTWQIGPRYRVQVPICPRCRKRTIARIWIRRLIDLVILGLSIAIAIVIDDYLLKGWIGRMTRRFTALGILVAAYFLGSALLDYLLPLPLDLTAFPSTVMYKFRDLAYASEFTTLNNVIDDDDDQDEDEIEYDEDD